MNNSGFNFQETFLPTNKQLKDFVKLVTIRSFEEALARNSKDDFLTIITKLHTAYKTINICTFFTGQSIDKIKEDIDNDLLFRDFLFNTTDLFITECINIFTVEEILVSYLKPLTANRQSHKTSNKNYQLINPSLINSIDFSYDNIFGLLSSNNWLFIYYLILLYYGFSQPCLAVNEMEGSGKTKTNKQEK